MNDFVMRSVYLRPKEDSELRQLAHEMNVTKSDLIRAAIGAKLLEWHQSNSNELILRDLQLGLRQGSAGIDNSVEIPKLWPNPAGAGKPARQIAGQGSKQPKDRPNRPNR